MNCFLCSHQLQTVCFKKKRTIHTQESNLEIDEAGLADKIFRSAVLRSCGHSKKVQQKQLMKMTKMTMLRRKCMEVSCEEMLSSSCPAKHNFLFLCDLLLEDHLSLACCVIVPFWRPTCCRVSWRCITRRRDNLAKSERNHALVLRTCCQIHLEERLPYFPT